MHGAKGVVAKHPPKIEMQERKDRTRHAATWTWNVKELGERAFHEAKGDKQAHSGNARSNKERSREEWEGAHIKSHDLWASEADHRAEGK